MPGHCQLSPDMLADEISQSVELGLGGVILFGIPDKKDAEGSDAMSDSGIIAQAIRAAKQASRDFLVITDVCCCEYTDHGHCGAIGRSTGRIDVENDATLEMIAKQAVVHARAGADMVAPSGMIDGMVGAIRKALDAAGFAHVPIMSYAAKYASAFYGPFREAAESAPQFGDRRGYQMDPASAAGQAMREIELDLAEGADIVMVKPALAVSRHHPPGPRAFSRRAVGGLQRLGRVQHGEGGGRARLARRATDRPGMSDGDPPRRREHHSHLLGERRRPLARVVRRSESSCGREKPPDCNRGALESGENFLEVAVVACREPSAADIGLCRFPLAGWPLHGKLDGQGNVRHSERV